MKWSGSGQDRGNEWFILGPEEEQKLFGIPGEGFKEEVKAGFDVVRVFGMKLASAHITPINSEEQK